MKTHSFTSSPLATALLLLCGALGAQVPNQVPNLINYQGRVAVSGINFDGSGQFKFALVDGGTNTAQVAQLSANIAGAGGQVTGINVTFPGSGYTTPPVITISTLSGNTGSGATATATVSNGQVTAVTVTNGGSGYSASPKVTAANPPPSFVYQSYWSNDGTYSPGGGAGSNSEPTTAVPLTVAKGLYTVLLGDTTLTNMTPVPASVFSHTDVRLRVWFNDGSHGSQMLTPDQRIASAGFAIMAGTVVDGSIDSSKLGTGAVGTSALADGGVTTAKLASGAVNSTQIANGAIGTNQIATGAVGQAQIGNGAVGSLQIASGSVGQTHLAAGAVGNTQLATGAVTAAKISNGQVVKTLNSLTDDVTLAPGANVTITPAGSTLTIAAVSGLPAVTHDTTLTGAGTGASPLSIANGGLTGSKLTLPLVLSGAVANGNILSVSNTGPDGLALISTSDTGIGVYGTSNYNVGVYGFSANYDGVYGFSSGGSGIHGASDTGVAGQFDGNIEVTGNTLFGAQTRQMLSLYDNGTYKYGIGVQSSTLYQRAGAGGGFAWYSGGVHNDGQNNAGGGTTLMTLDPSGNLSTKGNVTAYGSTGIFGIGTVNGGTGVYGSAGGNGANGVYGGGYSGANGVYGSSTGIGGGTGVYGNGSVNGVYGYGNNGVYGETAGTGTGAGIYGIMGAQGGYAGYFYGVTTIQGNLQVFGPITAEVKDFQIDHPLDPAGKYLVHASIESSEMKNLYDGISVLDGAGGAVVQLPSWRSAPNGEFRYQLTCLGAFAPVYVAEEIAGNQFKIAGGRPGMKVSWQVTGIRHDAYAAAHPIVAEQEKPTAERGTYQHPELYGQPEEKSLAWKHDPALMQRLKDQRNKPAVHTPSPKSR